MMARSQFQITAIELQQHFPQLFLEIIGTENEVVTHVSAPEAADKGALVFLSTPKALEQGLNSKASVLAINKKYRAEAEARRDGKTILVCPQAELALALVTSQFFFRTPYTNPSITDVHPTAIIGENTDIASGARIGPHVVIGSGVKIEKNVFVGANSVIENGSAIGEDSVIHPLVYIGHSTSIGKRCEIHPHSVIGKEGFGYAHDDKFNHYRIPHQGRVVLEDDVHIGGCVTIDRSTFAETRIQAGTKFDNHIHVAHNCRIGTNSLITAGFLMAGSSKIGANFVTGGNTVVTGHIEVCDNVQVSALSAISKGISKPGQYGGSPLLPLQQHIKMKAALAHLPAMRKSLSLILKKLGLKADAANED